MLASVVKFFHPHPYRLVQNKRYTRDPSGRKRLLTKKSSKSSTAPPNTANPSQLHKLYPSTHGIESKIIAMALTKLDFFLLHPVNSIPQEMIFSNTARIVENAAKDINTKNRLPHNLPIGIWLKIFGRVIKISPGPEVWSTLNVKQAGKIISPEVIATNVSKRAMFKDSPSKERSFPI